MSGSKSHLSPLFPTAALLSSLLAMPVCAEEKANIPVPLKTIFAGQEIAPEMLRLRVVPQSYVNANPVLASESLMVGKVARHTLPSGQPVMSYNIEERDAVTVNQPTIMTYQTRGLTISTEVVPLNSAKAGETVRVRNRFSRQVIVGRALENGNIAAEER